jgi:hypothetical protein
VSARGTFTAHACEMPFASNAQRSGPVERDEQKAEASGGYASSRYAYIAAASTITIMIRISTRLRSIVTIEVIGTTRRISTAQTCCVRP